MSTDRCADEPPAVVDFDSRRRVREAQTAIQRARERRERIAETRTVHAPMSGDQADAIRTHRRTVTDRAEGMRNKIRINNCQLCDEDGYAPRHVVCDHRDHRPAAQRGMAAIRAAMGWPSTQQPAGTPDNPAGDE
ncbi:hypothetical protein [Mycolicibacterium fortuitum]|uniref:hypothetical protein n=1 Tax=Mycolicibacterium fortuitum TaxID=1766 RepID=UPI00113246E4|nr:hypothetical protein [Mycolicibacterium fortuitum]TPW93675.1 hypothetical protein FKW78_18620 [Mycolicibacterium fortuitum]